MLDLQLQLFFHGFYFHQQLENVPSYYPMQLPEKLISRTRKITKKTNFGLIFAYLSQIWASNFFCRFYICQQLGIFPYYHPMQFFDILQFLVINVAYIDVAYFELKFQYLRDMLFYKICCSTDLVVLHLS